MHKEQDVVDILRDKLTHHAGRLAYHQDQIERIKRAIAILRDEPTQKLAPAEASEESDGTYPWSASIDRLFQVHDQLSVDEVRRLLINEGLPADEEKYARTVQATMARKCNNRILKRVSQGVYRKTTPVEQVGMKPTFDTDENNGTTPVGAEVVPE